MPQLSIGLTETYPLFGMTELWLLKPPISFPSGGQKPSTLRTLIFPKMGIGFCGFYFKSLDTNMHHMPSRIQTSCSQLQVGRRSPFDREPVMKTGAQGPRIEVYGLGNLDLFWGLGCLFGDIGTRIS